MCIGGKRTIVQTPTVDPEVERAKEEERKRQAELKAQEKQFTDKTQAGKTGKRSLISGQSGGIGYYKETL